MTVAPIAPPGRRRISGTTVAPAAEAAPCRQKKAKAVAPAPIPVPQLVELYLDHPKVGCGWRRYLVIHAGRKIVRLLATGDAVVIQIPRADFAAMNPPPQKLARTSFAARLRDVARTYGRDKDAPVRLALSLLRKRP